MENACIRIANIAENILGVIGMFIAIFGGGISFIVTLACIFIIGANGDIIPVTWKTWLTGIISSLVLVGCIILYKKLIGDKKSF
jgi:hypothetical protein